LEIFEMELHGTNIIAGTTTRSAAGYFTARGGLARFEEATEEHISLAFHAAESAFHELRQIPAERRAAFLERIGEEIDDHAVEVVAAERGIAVGR